jgi:hypothetical protein
MKPNLPPITLQQRRHELLMRLDCEHWADAALAQIHKPTRACRPSRQDGSSASARRVATPVGFQRDGSYWI